MTWGSLAWVGFGNGERNKTMKRERVGYNWDMVLWEVYVTLFSFYLVFRENGGYSVGTLLGLYLLVVALWRILRRENFHRRSSFFKLLHGVDHPQFSKKRRCRDYKHFAK